MGMQPAAVLRSERAAHNQFEARPGFCPFSPNDAESSIAARFRAAAERYADSVALVEGRERLTYRQLLACAANVARSLHSHLGNAKPRVGILLPFRSPTVTAILGTPPPGGPYSPLFH